MMNDVEGAYTKTQAYNFVKNLLGLSKRDPINKNFFSLFFKESDGYYVIKTSEDSVKKVFTEGGIVELNKIYYQKKQENDPKAKEIAQKVMTTVQQLLNAA